MKFMLTHEGLATLDRTFWAKFRRPPIPEELLMMAKEIESCAENWLGENAAEVFKAAFAARTGIRIPREGGE